MTRMRRLDQRREFPTQRVELVVAQHPDAGDIPVFAVKLDLFVAEPITRPVIGGRKQAGNRVVITRQVFGHQPASLAARPEHSNDSNRDRRRPAARLQPGVAGETPAVPGTSTAIFCALETIGNQGGVPKMLDRYTYQ